ncbi:MAG TPA: VOC family protein [Gemmatimonadaceae bacterium]|nr:VOC family protein [Gemmatimonadaceae bacterium]
MDHVGLTVPDLDQAIEFLTRVLGCQLLYKTSAAFDSTGGDWMTRHYGVNARATLRTAMLRCGPTTNVELLQWEVPGSPSSPNDLAAASAGHLAIYVDDVRQAMEYLAAEPGVRILGAPTVVTGEPNEGTEFVFAQTPWGLYIELVRWPRLMPYCTLTPERLVNPATSWR